MNRFARTGETADPCGVPLVRCSSVPSGALQRRRQPPLDIQQHPARSVRPRSTALTTRSHGTLSKNFRTSKIDHPVVLPAPLPGTPRSRRWADLAAADSHRSPGETSAPPTAPDAWPRPSARPCLRSSAPRASATPPPCGLGISTALTGGRKVGPRTHPIPDLVQVARCRSSSNSEILPVHARRALIGPDPPPRLPDQRLGNHKRLRLRLVHPVPPTSPRLTDQASQDDPSPSLRPALQGPHRYYGQVRPCAPRRYSPPRRSAAWGSRFRRPAAGRNRSTGRPPDRATGSQFRTRARTTLAPPSMPDTDLASQQAPARPIPEATTRPRFWMSPIRFRHVHRRFALARLRDPHLTR